MKTLLQILFKTTKRKIFVTILTLYTLFGFILLPYLIQSNFSNIIQEKLGTQGYVGRVYINPYTFEFRLKNLLIKDDNNENLLYFRDLYLDFEFTSLLFLEPTVKNFSIDSLKTSITLYKNKRFNYTHILEQLAKTKTSKLENETQKADTEKKSSLVFNLEKFHLSNARIVFKDETKSTAFLLESKPFDFTLKDFSTQKNKQASLETNISFKDTLALKLNSKLTATPFHTEGKIAFTKINLAKIYSYAKDDLNFSFKGFINTLNTNFSISNASKVTNEKEVKTLRVQLENTNLDIPTINYKNKDFSLSATNFKQTIKNIHITKDKNLSYQLHNIILENKQLNFLDLRKEMKNPLSFKNIAVDVDTFSSDKTQQSLVTLSLNTPKSGSVNISTKALLEPYTINTQTKIRNLSIVPYQIYIKDFINLDIKNMNLDSTTKLLLTKKATKLDGEIKLSKIDLWHSLTKKRLLKADLLSLNGLQYTNNNFVVQSVLLDTFNTQFKIAKDKTTNVANLMVKKEEKTTSSKKSSPKDKNTKKQKEKKRFHYYIKKLQLKNGATFFSDHSLPLNFDTNIHSLNANVDDLSSKNRESMIILNGVVEKYGLANIQAKTITTNFKNKTDVAIKFKNLDVRSFSPYSGKFIGQKISDGKLWLDLNYDITEGQLQSTNNIKIKNLTLGEDVESKDALNLPVGLAIALLEDSDHLIDLDVPVTGDMNNPKFELGGVIWKTLGNIITNIVSAPFKFLGSLMGLDSDELGEVDFNYGSAIVLAPQKEKLDKLISVLHKKNSLALELQGSYDKEKDKQVLVNNKFNLLIKSDDKEEKIRTIFEEKFGDEVLENIEDKIENDKEIKETEKTKKIIDALSNKIKDTIIISNQELEQLGKMRAQNLQKYFLSHKLTLDRIQIKKDVKVEDTTDKAVFTFKLELKVKDK